MGNLDLIKQFCATAEGITGVSNLSLDAAPSSEHKPNGMGAGI